MHCSKRGYYIRVEKSLSVSLLIFIIIFTVSKHYGSGEISGFLQIKKIEIDVEELPPITQKKKTAEMPMLPSVPIPSEDELIPEDETIEDTDFKEVDDIPSHDSKDFPVISNNIVFRKTTVKGKQMKSGYVKLLVFVNKFGQVDSVRVIENTTNSRKKEMVAIRRAYSTSYIDQIRKKRKSRWIERVFNFDSREH
ncbi:hypothetical protein J7K93_10075 [bacterium]|nr:hypothetical protein [bacterium]